MRREAAERRRVTRTVGTQPLTIFPSLGEWGQELSTAAAQEPDGDVELEGDADRADKPDEALRFRLMQLQDEHGEIPADGLKRASAQMALMRARLRTEAKASGKSVKELKVAGLSSDSWTWLGPGNVGGRIRSIVIDPTDANRMWVGSIAGGIWRTTDAGASWQPVNDFMTNLANGTTISVAVVDTTLQNRDMPFFLIVY